MKILHTADLHIGLESHGPMNPHTGLPRRLEDFLGSLDAIVDTAIEEHADLVIMAGDIYKGRDPSATHQRLFARRVLRLVQSHIPVFLLAGNHDLPNAVSRATSIDIFHELEVSGVSVARSPEVRRIETASGPVLMAALPWVTRSSLLAHEEYRSLGAQDLERQLVSHIVGSAEELAEEVQDARAEAGMAEAPAVLAAHLHAQEARDGAERLLTVGNDPLVPIDRVALDAFDYVALGHIHAHQQLHKQPPAVYPGSIERVNFGEEKEKKGFVIAEVERGRCSWAFRKLPAREFVTIDVKATADDPTVATLAQIERRAEQIRDAVVRVRVRLTPQNQALFDENQVRAALADAFWIAEIYRDVDRPVRSRLAGVSVEGKEPLELLDGYFAEKQVPAEERQRLHEYAHRLLNTLGDP
jgi:DNA repair protein SbcD/Mre11